MTDLDGFLKATDLDDLLRVRGTIASLSPAESERVVAVLRDWRDEQAVANLLFHPDLIPDAARVAALDRALLADEADYFALAATVGLQGVAFADLPAEKRDPWTQALLAFAQSASPVLARRACITLGGWSESSSVILSHLAALYPAPDVAASRNIVAAVLNACGDASLEEFDRRLAEWRLTDTATAAFHTAFAEYADARPRDPFAAMLLKAPALAYIPNLSEGALRGASAGPAAASAPRLRLMKPLLLGLVVGPLAVRLHEAGHASAASAMGAAATVHATSTSVHADPAQSGFLWILAAGPAVELGMAVVGLVWLLGRRRGRLGAPADLLDWIATFMAGLSLRWLTRVPIGVMAGLRSGAYTVDEALVSIRLGAAPWVLPLLLIIPAAAAFVLVVRQHPPRARLVPLLIFFVAQGIGLMLWASLR